MFVHMSISVGLLRLKFDNSVKFQTFLLTPLRQDFGACETIRLRCERRFL